mmetsp:Transcript_5572/g.34558  ORF Transcript_5572/g.34558 Transcript_5572/m.34558 type:complete len:232 (+) Transcript_5572:2307-3002(+)
MRPTVDDVERRHGKNQLGVPRKICQVLVQGHSFLCGSGLGHGHGHGKDGVGPELPLVGGAVELDHELVQFLLLGGILADESGCDHRVDVFHGLEHGLAHVALLVAIAQFHRFVDTGRGSAGHGCTEGAFVGGHVAFHGGIPARIEDLASHHLGDHRWRGLGQVVRHERRRFFGPGFDARIDHVFHLLGQAVLVDVLLHAHVDLFVSDDAATVVPGPVVSTPRRSCAQHVRL